MRRRTALTFIALTALTLRAIPADAGCGCNKPPPPAASVRPAFASPGDSVSLFSSRFERGRTYRVIFGDGLSAVELQG